MDFGRESPSPKKAGRKTRLRSAAIPQQQAGVLQTSESPSWNALKLYPIPAARGRLAGYRIGEDQSACMKAILRPAEPSERKSPRIRPLPFKTFGQRLKIKRSTVAHPRGAAAARPTTT